MLLNSELSLQSHVNNLFNNAQRRKLKLHIRKYVASRHIHEKQLNNINLEGNTDRRTTGKTTQGKWLKLKAPGYRHWQGSGAAAELF